MSKFGIFLFALIAGALTRSGIMTVENLILNAWDSLSYSLLFTLAPEWHFYILIVGCVIFLIVAYCFLEPFIHGLEYGSPGLFIAIFGFIFGMGLMEIAFHFINSEMGLPS